MRSIGLETGKAAKLNRIAYGAIQFSVVLAAIVDKYDTVGPTHIVFAFLIRRADHRHIAPPAPSRGQQILNVLPVSGVIYLRPSAG